MNTKLYIGNLSFDSTENDLRDLFAAFGAVTEVNLITDRATGRSRGFAFVTMASEEAAKAAIAGAADKELHGRKLSVNEARPREERTGDRGSGGPRRNQPR
ncbi:MAG: RNA-binding protein [Verrucomicrobiota bacterium]|jgi:RNA recognition motif-containing protein